MLTIEIVDHGPGVPVAALATLTQPFVRLDAAQAATHGTGLGLAIVERLARAHGGSLELDNAPHAGLRARLRLQAPVA
jgi:two-component system osmolarity sensor histidine kinase EnvZ